MTQPNPKLDFYFSDTNSWLTEVSKLREIVLACDLRETLKWGHPCYTFEDGNIVLIHEFKDYCALLFFKGALLKDPEEILVQQTPNVQSARQIRFTSTEVISDQEETIREYVREAIDIEKAGLEVEFKDTSDFPVPVEFQERLDDDAALRSAFESLTPGRQRQYLLHFGNAKQAKTRQSRVEKCIPLILDGIGLKDA